MKQFEWKTWSQCQIFRFHNRISGFQTATKASLDAFLMLIMIACVRARACVCVCVNKCKIMQPCFDNLLLRDVAPNLKQLVASYRVLLRPSPAAPLQTDEHARAHFHTKHQLVPRQDAFIRRRMTPRVVFSKRVSSPVPVFTCPPARAARAHSLSPECVVEMDALRRVRARRGTEAGPWRSAAVNKVKNNQVMADGGSLRARCR